MNRAKLKEYARQARREFIQAVTDRAAYYGLTPKKTEPIIEKGDVALIAGRAFPRAVAQKRKGLEERISRHGFEQVMEMMAYTWFNRFVAIRFMELHGYLDHGYRVLSHPEGKAIPEILEHAEHVDLPGLDRSKVIELKLEGTKEEELYRMVLIAQCNALHSAMPFLFERVDDPTELLLADNLLNTDSAIRHMVSEILEEDWEEVEIIGWMYQFYISEKKDVLMKAKKAYKTEDIPAVTQLFTPNWIVKYLVQNSLGAKWLATYPNSPLRHQMAYYIEPAEQTPEVHGQLKAITPESLNPEEITLLDLACGSGHILVESYDLFKAIYQERGYRAKDIPRLILEKNLYGLEIDDRAAQLAGFALMMKARGDDREIFKKRAKPNVVVIKEMTAPAIKEKTPEGANDLVELFKDAKTCGSLIRVPEGLAKKLPSIKKVVEERKPSNDLWTAKYYEELAGILPQAELLSKHYDCVVANPPYMGGKGMNATLKEFAKRQYPDTKSDLFAMFIKRGFEMAKEDVGYNAMVTMQSWMFLLSFEKCRQLWLDTKTIQSMAHLGARAFSTISGEVVTVTTFSFLNHHLEQFKPTFLRLVDGDEEDKRQGIINKNNLFNQTIQDDFKKIPGAPIAYWVGQKLLALFGKKTIGEMFDVGSGLSTSDNNRFVRYIWEVARNNIAIQVSSCSDCHSLNQKWFLFQKGGEFRKWYGNLFHVVNWKNNGEEIKKWVINNPNDPDTTHWSRRIFNTELYFKNGITWSTISSGKISFRVSDEGTMISNAAGGIFSLKDERIINDLIAGINCNAWSEIFSILNPTLNYSAGIIQKAPAPDMSQDNKSCQLIALSRIDWDSYETSLDFSTFPFLQDNNAKEGLITLEQGYLNYRVRCQQMTDQMKQLEEENNRMFIEAYGLQDELTTDVPIEEVTLFANPYYRYNGELSEAEREGRFKEDTIKELISYSVGCMMGRYSLDMAGLVYANAENKGFDASKYKTFPADQDGIIPIMEGEWFPEDASKRLIEFIGVVWPKEHLEEDLKFIADSLDPNRREYPQGTIRKYLATGFFRGHLKIYKNRPIYWLFSSGTLRAFQCLAYLHRYNESTLSRMRTEYVIPLQGKIASRIEQLWNDIQNATSTSHRRKMEKERDTLIKQQAELQSFDEKLRHYADLRISLDLDDGVKVNYGKFGDLLAEVKSVTGGGNE
jgi:type II restriction/modification system DNA methylase subunit YeeA